MVSNDVRNNEICKCNAAVVDDGVIGSNKDSWEEDSLDAITIGCMIVSS